MQEIGFNADMSLETAGFYPQGGGRVKTNIRSTQKLTPVEFVKRGRLLRIQGISAVSNLDPNIAARQKHQALRRLEARCRDTKIKTIEIPSPARGTFLLLLAQFEYSRCCYFALGERGKPAERVADEAVDAMEAFLATDGAIDQYLADQLLVPLAITSGPSQLSTSKVTQHLCTNADIIREFLPVKIYIHGDIGEPGLISVTPAN
jgi:RNA 3'-terminal phosphate cyclase (ATP)